MVDMTLIITNHAIERYRERVEPVSYDEVVARLNSPTITKAAEIGCGAVRLSGGQRVIIADGAVLTVIPKQSCCRRRHGRRYIEREE